MGHHTKSCARQVLDDWMFLAQSHFSLQQLQDKAFLRKNLRISSDIQGEHKNTP